MAIQQKIRAVIFDMGGVLLRTDDPEPRTALAQRLNLSRIELENIVFGNSVTHLAEHGRATHAEIWEEISCLLKLPLTEMPEIEQAFFAGDRVDFDLIKDIQSLRPAYVTALLSNAWDIQLADFLNNELHIPDTFDVIVSSAALGITKPDPRIYQTTLDLVKAKPNEAIFVDDNAANISAAAAMGIRTIQFISPTQTRRELNELLGSQ